jgi:uncharacterized protein YwqG
MIEEIREQLRRKAVVMDIEEHRPSTDLSASWFGRVSLALPDELWPMSGHGPMHALCQINLTDMPLQFSRLSDFALITVFIDPSEIATDKPNGQTWCLRAYKQLEMLCPLQQMDSRSSLKALPMYPRIVEDFPCLEDVKLELPSEIRDNYYDLFENTGGLKLGGWPTLIQSEIYWAPLNKHPIAPEYIFQVDSTEEGNWMWGDCGVGYFGRGTLNGHTDEWALEWQCF